MCCRGEGDAVRTVDFLGDGGDFFFHALLGFVDEVEVIGLIHGCFDFFGQFQAAFAAFGPDLGEGNFGAALVAGGFDEIEFFLGVGGEGVDSYYGRQTEFLDVFNVFFEVLAYRVPKLTCQLCPNPSYPCHRAF